jgi:hypothetical protein
MYLYMRMKRWKAIAAVVLLALWAGCFISCAVENMAAAKTLACCKDEPGDAGQAPEKSSQCACLILVSGAFAPYSQALDAPLDVAFSSSPCPSTGLPATVVGLVALDASPPDLGKGWQFMVRAALLARAPSFVS